MENLIAYITLFINLLPELISSGEQILPLINRVKRLLKEGGVPTAEDWELLDELNEKYTRVIQADIPGESPA